MEGRSPSPNLLPLYATVALLTGIWVALVSVFRDFRPFSSFEFIDASGELAIVVMSLIWMAFVAKMPKETAGRVWLFVGAVLFYIGTFEDALDEVFGLALTGFLLIENIGKVGGVVAASIGLWQRDRQRGLAVDELRADTRRLSRLSITDQLTGLYNRGHFDRRLPETIIASRALRVPLSLIMLDIDDFKHHNDTYGHPEGDKVIIGLADAIRGAVRRNDSSFRYGGEELVVVLPATSEEQAVHVAERIVRNFREQGFEPEGGGEVFKTVSAGVASLLPGENAGEIVRRTDQALYRAKRAGKNRVVLDAH